MRVFVSEGRLFRNVKLSSPRLLEVPNLSLRACSGYSSPERCPLPSRFRPFPRTGLLVLLSLSLLRTCSTDVPLLSTL